MPFRLVRRCAVALALLPALPTLVSAQTTAPPPATLPAPVLAALTRAQIDTGSLYAWVAPADGGEPRLAHQAAALAHPASVMKVVTTMAALERLGPVFQWRTPVLHHGGDLYVRGSGDPRLSGERLGTLLRQAMDALGSDTVGDIVLDRSAFAIADIPPGAFDGEPLRPYNVRPDALMIQQKSLLLTLRPDTARGVARVAVDLPLAGVRWPATVPLADGPCQDWRGALGLDLGEPTRPRLAGRYPASCGEQVWPLAWVDPGSFNARAIEAQWRAIGGRLRGMVREGRVPTTATPLLTWPSPPLPEVLRDMNKFSNNMIAQHVLLALSPGQPQQPATLEAARAEVQALVQSHGCRDDELVVDNGAGLSRQERITARCLGRLLQWAWTRPWMPELLGSLPVAGIETTARRAVSVAGRAHLKTGSLDGVATLAGYVHGDDGRRHVLVALINHPQAGRAEARAVLDALAGWALASSAGGSPDPTDAAAPR